MNNCEKNDKLKGLTMNIKSEIEVKEEPIESFSEGFGGEENQNSDSLQPKDEDRERNVDINPPCDDLMQDDSSLINEETGLGSCVYIRETEEFGDSKVEEETDEETDYAVIRIPDYQETQVTEETEEEEKDTDKETDYAVIRIPDYEETQVTEETEEEEETDKETDFADTRIMEEPDDEETQVKEDTEDEETFEMIYTGYIVPNEDTGPKPIHQDKRRMKVSKKETNKYIQAQVEGGTDDGHTFVTEEAEMKDIDVEEDTGSEAQEDNVQSSLNKKGKEVPNCSSKSMSSFVMRTTKSNKEEIDKQIAKAIYATNSSFMCIEQAEVKKAMALLRPGYVPPSRHDVCNRLLNEVYNEEKSKCFKDLSGSSVCLSLDGWSNVDNEPILCATVTMENGSSFLVDTIDTSGNSHTSAYLTELALNLIKMLKVDYNCTVISFVTDNDVNINAMSNQIKESTEINIITYSCASHILNLLCKDLEISEIKEHVTYVVRYFQNNHFASATFAKEGGKKLLLPSDVRCNSLAECLQGFVESWPTLLKISEEHKNDIDNIISQKISNIYLKRRAEDYLKVLKHILVAIDRLQRNDVIISDVVEQFKILETYFNETEFSSSQMQKFRNRYNQCITPYHLLAFLLDPTKTEHKLTEREKNCALEAINLLYPGSGLLPLVIKFLLKCRPFAKIMFNEEILKNTRPLDWWKSQRGSAIIEKLFPILKQLFSATASSVSFERIFSSSGLIHFKLRNGLGTE